MTTPAPLTRDGSELIGRAATFTPSTWNAEARTIEVVWTTGADVVRYDWRAGRNFIERLAITPEALDLTRLNGGAPVLDSHDSYELDSILGVVVDGSARIVNGMGTATVRFSERPELAGLIADIAAGIIRNLSVGYTVQSWTVTEASGDSAEIRTATRWTPFEMSFVAIPADAAAQTRAMPPSGDVPPASPNPTAARAAPQEPQMTEQVLDQAAQIDAATTRAVQAEQARTAAILQIAEQGGQPPTWAREMIEKNVSVDAARAAAYEEVCKRATPARPTVEATPRPSGDDPANIVRAMADALAVHGVPALATSKDVDPRFREFAGMRPSDMLIALAEARGERVTFRDRSKLIARSFHTTSDFPLLLEAASNKMLLAGFEAAAPAYRTFFAQKSFNDFKAHKFLMAGDFPAPTALSEGGDIAVGTISEKRENITPITYARQVRITRQMLINDDLGAFTDFGAMIGRRVADFENTLAFTLMNTATGDGPTLSTGSAAVFGTAAARANKAASGGAIAEASLDAGYAAMMAQASIDGIKLNLRPRFLLTGAAYRGAALRYTSPVVAQSGANVAIYSDLTPVADSNIPGNRWYLFADPASAPVYVYGYVNGQTAPMIRVNQYLPGTDGMSVEVVHDFAVGAVDHRGGYFNAGA